MLALLVFCADGLPGVALLHALVLQARAPLPSTEDGLLVEGAVVAWAQRRGWTLLLVALGWAGGLVALERGRRWGRLSPSAPPVRRRRQAVVLEVEAEGCARCREYAYVAVCANRHALLVK